MTGPRPSFASIRDELWRKLAANAFAVAGPSWSGDRVLARHAGWTLVLDSYRVPVDSFDYTRMFVALPSLGFRFRIYEPNALSFLRTLFGLFDIEIGDEAFDRRWLIKSSSRRRIRELLADQALRNRIDELGLSSLSLEADLSQLDTQDEHEDWNELVLVRAELQTSEAELCRMFDLVAATLERLELGRPREQG